MSPKRPQPGSSDAWSPETLARLLAAKQAEADRKLADALSSRCDQLRYLDELRARMGQVTNLFELGRLVVGELQGTFGASQVLLGLVEEVGFLEVVAASQAVPPRYQLELMEEAFIVGERLDLGGDGLDWQTPGSSELPAGVSLSALPISRADSRPLGVLLLEGGLNADRASWLEAFVELVSLALEDCQTYGHVEQLVVDAVVAISSAHAAKIEGAAPLHGRHVRRVEELSLQLARVLDLSPSDTQRVRLTALLHDMDATAISRAFGALRRGKLTEQAWRDMVEPRFASTIYASPLSNFQRLVDDMACLRCRWDGKGNQPAVAGSELPLAARVVSVAEAFENLTGLRRHRTTLSIPGALDQIRRLAGAQYDPQVVDALCTLYAALEIEATVARRPEAS